MKRALCLRHSHGSSLSAGLARLVAALALGLLWSAASASAQATVTVKIDGLKGTEGVALVALYDSPEAWLKVPKAVQVVRAKITGAGLVVELKGVKPGTYAVSVIHDENKNNELDMRWLPYPKPKEGAGSSGSQDSGVGPPKWEGAKLDVAAAGASISVSMKYP